MPIISYRLTLVISIWVTVSSCAFSSIFSTHALAGKDAYEKEDKATAKEEFDMAIRTWTPGDGVEEKAAVYSMLGLLNMADTKYDIALENFNEVLKLKSNEGHPHLQISLIYSAQGKNQLAIEEIKKQVKAEPDYYRGQWTLGNLYRITHQTELAIPCFAKATTLNPKSDSAYAGLGDCYKTLGKYTTATDCFEQAVKLNHDNAIAYYNLGQCHAVLKQYDKAIEDYQNALTARVITLSAFKVEVYTFLGEAYEHSGQPEKAKEAYKQAKELLDAIPNRPLKSSSEKEK